MNSTFQVSTGQNRTHTRTVYYARTMPTSAWLRVTRPRYLALKAMGAQEVAR